METYRTCDFPGVSGPPVSGSVYDCFVLFFQHEIVFNIKPEGRIKLHLWIIGVDLTKNPTKKV